MNEAVEFYSVIRLLKGTGKLVEFSVKHMGEYKAMRQNRDAVSFLSATASLVNSELPTKFIPKSGGVLAIQPKILQVPGHMSQFFREI